MNSKTKGSSFEREICKLLSEHFKLPFVRNPNSFGSGAWSSSHKTEGLDLENISGDIITPKGFKFNLECKKGYGNLNITSLMEGLKEPIKSFVFQCNKDCLRTDKLPLVIWKPDRAPILAITLAELIPKYEPFRIYAEGYVILGLEALLQETDHKFWFKEVL